MQSPRQETFTIPAIYEDFKNWLSSYRRVTENDFFPFNTMYRDHKYMLDYYIRREDGDANILFEIENLNTEVLSITITLFNRHVVENDDPTAPLRPTNAPVLVDAFRALAEAIKNKYKIETTEAQVLATSNPVPPMPMYNIEGWAAVFDWYYKIPRWVCPTLPELAKKQGLAAGTVRNNHAKYVLEHGERPLE